MFGKKSVFGSFILIALVSSTAAQAQVLCRNKGGTVFIRESVCKKKEIQIDVASIGLLGPQGPQGAPGEQGPQGPEGVAGPTGETGALTECPVGMTLIPGDATSRAFCADSAIGAAGQIHHNTTFACASAGKQLCHVSDRQKICALSNSNFSVWTDTITFGFGLTNATAFYFSCSGGSSFSMGAVNANSGTANHYCCKY